VRELLLQHVNSKKSRVQLAAISSLGVLGDQKAISVLEKFTTAPKESPERTASDKALAALRENRKSPLELGALRTEVLALQRENRDLRKQFDELKHRIESTTAPAIVTKTNRPSISPRASR